MGHLSRWSPILFPDGKGLFWVAGGSLRLGSCQCPQSVSMSSFSEGSVFLCHYSLTCVGFLGVSVGERGVQVRGKCADGSLEAPLCAISSRTGVVYIHTPLSISSANNEMFCFQVQKK